MKFFLSASFATSILIIHISFKVFSIGNPCFSVAENLFSRLSNFQFIRVKFNFCIIFASSVAQSIFTNFESRAIINYNLGCINNKNQKLAWSALHSGPNWSRLIFSVIEAVSKYFWYFLNHYLDLFLHL